ncbi:vacuolar assembly protein, partial [Aspergillus sclerotialis]
MDAPGATEPTKTPGAHQAYSEAPTVQKGEENRNRSTQHESDDDNEGDREEGEEDEEDEEPQLKYAYLTKHLGSVYRNGDATSCFLSAGDKMIIGTHNGNIHVLSLPLLQPLRVYHAHSASITAISISPFPPPLPNFKPDALNKVSTEDQGLPPRSSFSSGSLRGQPRPSHHAPLPLTSSNSIYIATSSIDGNVCIASLVDPKDVLLRNFGRPVQAIALSPEYKSDRTFLSGGRAGDLILTTGGRVGVSSNSTTMGGAAAAASSWLGSIGLGANTGKDTVLHSGEGSISTIKWSLSGKYVTWVNEEGIKIMRSNLHLDSSDSELAWKRISHIDRPNLPGWEEMASVWKASAEWIDESIFETDDEANSKNNAPHPETAMPPQSVTIKETVEKLVVGWGGTIWVINVYPHRASRTSRDRRIGSVEVATILRIDCIISGVSLYTPNLLVVLSYIEAETESSEERSKHGVVRPGTNRRQRGLEPELRIIDIESKEEISADTLSVSRYENLTSSDYHLCLLPPWKTPMPVTQRGTLGTLGNGLWDATMYPAKLFSSGGSIRSTTSSGDKSSNRVPSTFASRRISTDEPLPKEVQDIAGTTCVRIFVHSPYDCVAAVRRDLTDRLAWLDAQGKYEEAWKLVDEHPEAAGPAHDAIDSTSETAASSLGEFFADDRSQATATGRPTVSAAEQEKRRIGELWIQQFVGENRWREAAEICAKVLHTTPRWEHWAWIFIKNNKMDEISPYIPIDLHPSLPSLIYEVILGHYVSRDRSRFKELVDLWPLDLFEASSVIAASEEQLKSEAVGADSEDWRILMSCIAKLYLADGHYREALHCYIQLQDADTAMTLIREHRLLSAVSDDIPAFIAIRVSKEQMRSAPVSELEEVTAEPIKLLVSEAYTGIVQPETVVTQLKDSNKLIFLYFYVRALWRGEALPAAATKPRRGQSALISDAANKLAADEGKAHVENFADTAVELFADYDRPLLMEFLQISTSYTFDTAISICDARHFTTELIYLFSKMGQTKRALNLILSDLKDVSQAISFAKSQNDPDLWEDLLDYSMDKPRFIHGLLVEAGTSIDPIKLVRRIPSGLEIEGLREGLTRMIREHDLQASISQGAAKVLQSEVAVGMDTLRRGQRRGIKFNIIEEESADEPNTPSGTENGAGKVEEGGSKPNTATTQPSISNLSGKCGGCHAPFHAN